ASTKRTEKSRGGGTPTKEDAIRAGGDAATENTGAGNYEARHKSAMNAEFVKGMRELLGGRNPDQFAVGGYDGIHLIYEALKKTNGNTDGDALINAMKGMAWESPRGPISIDPETRDIIQTVYLRRVEKLPDGELGNVEFDKIENVKDPVKEKMKADGKLTPDGLAK